MKFEFDVTHQDAANLLAVLEKAKEWTSSAFLHSVERISNQLFDQVYPGASAQFEKIAKDWCHPGPVATCELGREADIGRFGTREEKEAVWAAEAAAASSAKEVLELANKLAKQPRAFKLSKPGTAYVIPDGTRLTIGDDTWTKIREEISVLKHLCEFASGEWERYPLTIVATRYNGAYERGAFVAFPCDAYVLGDTWDSGDTPADIWWTLCRELRVLHGAGHTPDEALEALRKSIHGRQPQ